MSFPTDTDQFGPFAAGLAVVGAALGVAAGFGSGVFAGEVAVFAAVVGFGAGVGFTTVRPVAAGGVVLVFVSVVVAGGTSFEIEPLVHTVAIFSFDIVKLIRSLSAGVSGALGNAIVFPFIVS